MLQACGKFRQGPYLAQGPAFGHVCHTSSTITLQFPEGVLLVQYVEDLLLVAPTLDACLDASRKLLHLIIVAGLKVSESKLARKQVVF